MFYILGVLAAVLAFVCLCVAVHDYRKGRLLAGWFSLLCAAINVVSLCTIPWGRI